MPFPYFDETRELNDSTRKETGGSFIALHEGVTHYELSGPENGPAVVFTHGFSTPYFIFDTPFDYLAKNGFRVLRYDLFGRGLSDRPLARYNIDLFVRQLADLLLALRFEQVHLLGLSLGGPITASFVDRYPATVARQILIDPAGATRTRVSRWLTLMRLPGVGELVMALFGRLGMLKAMAKDLIAADVMTHFQARYQVQMQFAGFKRAILSTLRNGMLDSFFETYERVGKLGKPTLLFWGMQDRTVPFIDSAILRRALPQAEFHAIQNCGHLPHFEKPEIVNPILLEFLMRG